jgi:hypothetical protein
MLRTKRDLVRWHEKRHRSGSMETCFDCGRQKAKCRSKIFRYTDLDAAVEDARAMNRANGYVRPLTVYGCPWCDMYHLTSSLRHRRKSVTKEKRRWMFQQELERRARLAGTLPA